MSKEDYKSLERDHLIRLAEVGIDEAQEEIGYRLLSDNKYDESKLKEAAEWFSMAADQGNLYGMFNLASMYKMGLGVERDYEKAFSLFKESADLGLNISKYFLSEMYKEGLGTVVDEQRALELVTESLAGKALVTT